MNEQAINNPYTEDWQKELETKSYEELIRIVAYEENYNSEFIQMAKAKLEASEHYNEDEVQSRIEELRKKPLPKQKDPADTILKVANVGCITIKVLLIIIAIPITLALIFSDSTADNKAGAFIIYMGLWGIYKVGKKIWMKTRNKKEGAKVDI